MKKLIASNHLDHINLLVFSRFVIRGGILGLTDGRKLTTGTHRNKSWSSNKNSAVTITMRR